MVHWIDIADHEMQLGKLCLDHTPITLIFEDDPNYQLDCIPVWLTGDAYCVIVDQDDDGYGVKRGERIYGEPEDIGDVIIREKRNEAQPA